MPHLTGIIIANGGREALFEASDDWSIVELRCASEIHYVSPTPDPSYRAAMIALQPRLPTPVSVQQTQADSDK